MTDPVDTLRDSPVDFVTGISYALQPAMRRLVIVHLVGQFLFVTGLDFALVSRPFTGYLVGTLRDVVGLTFVVVGAAFLFGGLIGLVLKIVTDANRLARAA